MYFKKQKALFAEKIMRFTLQKVIRSKKIKRLEEKIFEKDFKIE